MAKAKAKASAKDEGKSVEDCLNDERFLNHIKQAAITSAEQNDQVVTGRASVLINNLDEEELKECIQAACCEPPTVGGSTSAEEGSCERCESHPAMGGIFDGDWRGKISDFIINMDPAVKQKIVTTILKYIGLVF